MSEAAARLEPFAEPDQRRRADTLGMFVFLASEVMLFGGLFAALAVDRVRHPRAAIEAAGRLNIWLGTANTAVLLTSSLLVALAAVAARRGRPRAVAWLFAAAAALGVGFLVIKGFEYRLEYMEGLMPDLGPPSPFGARPPSLFIALYFISTALHGLHVSVGVVLLGGTAVAAGRRRLDLPRQAATVDLVGLYWHLVDAIWVFLFPVLYLARA
jgi:cytochrome c oxidase subunit 3